MFKKITSSIFILIALSFAFFSVPVHAQQDDTFGIEDVDQSTELGGGDLIEIVGNIINIVLGFLGIIALVIILYGGYLIMTSGGKEDQIEKGKETLLNAVIGLVIIMSSFAIANFVINALSEATTRDGAGQGVAGGGPPALNSFSGSGGLGNMVEDHYPFRGEEDIDRNTKITVTFSKAVAPSTLIENTNGTCWDGNGNATTSPNCATDSDGNPIPYYGDCLRDVNNFSWEQHCDTLNTDAVQIYPSTTGTPQVVSSTAMATYENATDSQSAEAYTFMFKPYDNLGSNSEPMWYTVKLNDDIKQKEVETVNGQEQNKEVFAGNGYYSWEFETNTSFDLNPPQIRSVTPSDGEKISKNSIIQINFTEAMDPSSVQGIINDPKKVPFTNAIFNNTSTVGEWKVSNGYRTIEFIPNNKCGTNSCGQDIYCLDINCPASQKSCTSSFTGLVRTSQLTQPNSSWQATPFTGVRDMAGNALDGDADGTRDQKPTPSGREEILQSELTADNFNWSFTVENTIDMRIPYIRNISPDIDTPNVDSNASVNITFGLPMLRDTLDNIDLKEFTSDPSYLNQGNIVVKDEQGNVLDQLAPIWHKADSSNTTTSNGETYTEVDLRHREFGPNDMDLYYFTSVSGTVKSINQNCFYPGRGPASKGLTCDIEQDMNGTTQSKQNCTQASYDSGKDTSCPKQNSNMLKGDNSECISEFEKISVPVK